MLKTRIIPTLLWKNVGLVKGIGFNSWRRIGTVLPAIRIFTTRQVDELIFLDITASIEQRSPDFDEIQDFAAECFVPLTVGGGIASVDDAVKLLRVGADKICLNSITYKNPSLVTDIANMFGTQCVVVSIDAKKTGERYECFSHSGTRPAGYEVGEWVAEMEQRGAGEIIITSVEKDGTMQGYDLALIKKATESARSIPVIASGGAGNYEHMVRAIKEAGANAVAAASVFQFTDQTPLGAKKYLSDNNIPVRNAVFR